MSADTPPLFGWPHDESPFHEGEQAMQARAGFRERIEEIGEKLVRGAMPDQHRDLFRKLPFLVLGALDSERRPWAAIVAGPPGFVRAPDGRTLRIGALPAPGDPVRAGLRAGAPVGVLGIELATRRRNRANGSVESAEDGALVVRIGQSFGNCPKYIQARRPIFVENAGAPDAPATLRGRLNAAAAALVKNADTFFIATASADAGRPDQAASGGLDVSHRGGKPGFVRIGEENGHTVLTTPDFTGNFLFNTLGNLAVNPRAGLLVLDFANGDLLQLTGRAEAVWEGAELLAFDGAERLLKFHLDEGRWRPRALPLRATAMEYSPYLEETGSWDDVAARLK